MTVRQTLEAGSPFDIYKSVLTKKYADFTGRARRAEYWWFVLINFVVMFSLLVLTIILSGSNDSLTGLGGIIYAVYALGVILPSLAVTVRRLHDPGKRGWMLLIGLIPFVGLIILLVLYFTDGEPGANQYGPSPKYVS